MEKWLIIFRQNLKVPTIVTERGKNVAKSLDIKLFLSQNINYFVLFQTLFDCMADMRYLLIQPILTYLIDIRK